MKVINFFLSYLVIPLIGVLVVAFIILVQMMPEKAHLKYYEIPGWGKFVCSTDYTWGNKVVNQECWLLTADEKLVKFVETWEKSK